MDYSEFTEQVRIATITNNINVTITIEDIKFGFTAYTSLMSQGLENDASFNESIELILDKKHKKYTRVRG